MSEAAKPRGVVDLSKVQDVKDGRSASGRPNSIQLKVGVCVLGGGSGGGWMGGGVACASTDLLAILFAIQ